MGLDMYAYKVAKEHALGDFEIARDEEDIGIIEDNDLHYWRKHHDLHGWMERLYRAKGGTKESFNCVPVRLTREDLDRLYEDVVNNRLPKTTGFFFGDNPPDLESIAEDVDFIKKARAAIDEGFEVYYDSWW